MTVIIEKRLLQIAVFIAACVPVYAGLIGAYQGGLMFENDGTNADLSNHIRYMSGLLIGIGLCFWAMIPRIAYMGHYFCGMMVVILIGGLARLYGITIGETSDVTYFALAMELGVTPALYIWQRRLFTRVTNQS